MADITHRGNPVHTVGELPAVGSKAPAYVLTASDMTDFAGERFGDDRVVLNIFPSVDTGVCATSVRTFNKRAAQLENTTVVCVSKDLPYALGRFCGAEGISNVAIASAFRSDFGTTYGVELVDGVQRGLLSRAVVVIDTDGTVLYTEQVPEISQEPDYDAAIAALG